MAHKAYSCGSLPLTDPMTEAECGIVLGLFIGISLGLLVVAALP